MVASNGYTAKEIEGLGLHILNKMRDRYKVYVPLDLSGIKVSGKDRYGGEVFTVKRLDPPKAVHQEGLPGVK